MLAGPSMLLHEYQSKSLVSVVYNPIAFKATLMVASLDQTTARRFLPWRIAAVMNSILSQLLVIMCPTCIHSSRDLPQSLVPASMIYCTLLTNS